MHTILSKDFGLAPLSTLFVRLVNPHLHRLVWAFPACIYDTYKNSCEPAAFFDLIVWNAWFAELFVLTHWHERMKTKIILDMLLGNHPVTAPPPRRQ